MSKIKKIQVGNTSYEIRDANTYRSLSNTQAETLLNNGTYNGEEVQVGEIFNCEDGSVKEFDDYITYGGDKALNFTLTAANNTITDWGKGTAFDFGSGKKGLLTSYRDDYGSYYEIHIDDDGLTSSFSLGYGGRVGTYLKVGSKIYKVSAGNSNVIWYWETSDGDTWSEKAESPEIEWAYYDRGQAYYTLGKFLLHTRKGVYGGQNQQYDFTDELGNAWTYGTFPEGSDNYQMLVFSDEVRLINPSTSAIFSTTDLDNGWTDLQETATLPAHVSGDMFVVNDVAFCLADPNNISNIYTYYSLDKGKTWSVTNLPYIRINYGNTIQIVYVESQGTYVAIDNEDRSKYYTSVNGYEWTENTPQTGTTINNALFAGLDSAYTLSALTSSRIFVGAEHHRSLTKLEGALPSQAGNSGKFLTTDGTNTSWAAVDALPSQTGQGGKFLTTNGSNASWDSPFPSQTGNANKFLTTDGTNASWAAVPEALPNQVGNAGKALYTDGQDASWKVTRDPNTYRSLSIAQETQLIADGTYNGEPATSGEIFTVEDGTFKEFTDTVTFEGITMLTYDPSSGGRYNGGCFKDWAWITMYKDSNGCFAVTKDNGLTWSQTTPSSTFPGPNSYTGYGLTDGTTLYLMAGGYNGNFGQKTTDGINFTQFNCPANTPNQYYIHYGYCGGKFIVNKYYYGSDTYGTRGYVFSDDPSVSWTVGSYPTGVTNALMMIFSDSVYLIDEDTKRVYKTLPGEGFLTSWTDTGYNSDTTRSLTYTPNIDGLYVVNDIAFWMGNRNLEYSLDHGITWTQTSYSIKSVFYCKDTQTYIGLNYSTPTVYYTSTDGINWQQETVEAGKTIYTGCWTYNDNCVITLDNSHSSRINTEASHHFAVDSLSYNKTDVDTLVGGVLPSQTGQSGKFLKTDGTTTNWEEITTSESVEDLTDVDLTSVSNGQVLIYDSSDSKWKNGTLTGVSFTKITETLYSASWSNKSYSLTVPGVTNNSMIWVQPSYSASGSNELEYAVSNIRGVSQSADTIVFACIETPTRDVNIDIIIS